MILSGKAIVNRLPHSFAACKLVYAFLAQICL
jgi:hypothetical protein